MTTEVKIEHNGGNHAVIVEVTGYPSVALRSKGDSHKTYMHQGQSVNVREATNAEETELRGPSGPVE
ncbi:MAG: hypothetical protein WKF61_00615 [Luteimonas sp.]